MRVPATPGWVSLSAVVGAPRHSWLRAPGAVPATPGWGPLAAVVCGRLPYLAEGLGGGSPPLQAGVRRPRRWVFLRVGVSRVVCACGAARAGVCAVCLWRWCGCGCVFCVCWRVCGGVWRFLSLAGACCWC